MYKIIDLKIYKVIYLDMSLDLKKKLNNILSNKCDKNIIEIYLGKYIEKNFINSINLYYFEKLLIFFKNKTDDIKKKNYYKYYYDNKVLIIFENGSSVSNKVKTHNYDLIKNKNNVDLLFKTVIKKKISNDNFEPRYSYDKIEKIESIILTFDTYSLEFLKIFSKSSKYIIKINIEDYNNLNDIIINLNNYFHHVLNNNL